MIRMAQVINAQFVHLINNIHLVNTFFEKNYILIFSIRFEKYKFEFDLPNTLNKYSFSSNEFIIRFNRAF